MTIKKETTLDVGQLPLICCFDRQPIRLPGDTLVTLWCFMACAMNARDPCFGGTCVADSQLELHGEITNETSPSYVCLCSIECMVSRGFIAHTGNVPSLSRGMFCTLYNCTSLGLHGSLISPQRHACTRKNAWGPPNFACSHGPEMWR